jgi:hypothetical protein
MFLCLYIGTDKYRSKAGKLFLDERVKRQENLKVRLYSYFNVYMYKNV